MPAAVVYDNDIQNTYASRTRQQRYFVNIRELTRNRVGTDLVRRQRALAESEESRRQRSDGKRRGRYISTVGNAGIYGNCSLNWRSAKVQRKFNWCVDVNIK